MSKFESYEEALGAAADLKVEIADVFKPQISRQTKIFQGLWKPWKGKDLAFVRDIMLYQAGYPQEDSRAKIEGFRDKLAALVHVYDALDNLDNLNSYFAELGLSVEVTNPSVFRSALHEVAPKVKEQWDGQFFGEELIGRDMSVPDLWRTIMSCFLRHPLCGLMWVLCYAISKVEFMLRVDFHKYERGFFWTKSNPLKNNK